MLSSCIRISFQVFSSSMKPIQSIQLIKSRQSIRPQRQLRRSIRTIWVKVKLLAYLRVYFRGFFIMRSAWPNGLLTPPYFGEWFYNQANQSMEEILKNSSTSNSGSTDVFDKVTWFFSGCTASAWKNINNIFKLITISHTPALIKVSWPSNESHYLRFSLKALHPNFFILLAQD